MLKSDSSLHRDIKQRDRRADHIHLGLRDLSGCQPFVVQLQRLCARLLFLPKCLQFARGQQVIEKSRTDSRTNLPSRFSNT